MLGAKRRRMVGGESPGLFIFDLHRFYYVITFSAIIPFKHDVETRSHDSCDCKVRRLFIRYYLHLLLTFIFLSFEVLIGGELRHDVVNQLNLMLAMQ